jgi:hypothetical protein
VPLATQEQFLADAARIRQFRQNAGIFRRTLVSHFPAEREGRRHAMGRAAGRRVDSRAGGDSRRAGRRDLDLYFKSPTVRWEAGTHRLDFDHEKGHAELPIRLE